MSEVSALNTQRQQAKEAVDRRDMAKRLANNRDFKKLILEDFCVTECAAYAQRSADPALSVEARQDALNIAQASGHLRRWLQVIGTIGNQAESNLEDLDNAIVEAQAEDDAAAAEKLAGKSSDEQEAD